MTGARFPGHPYDVAVSIKDAALFHPHHREESRMTGESPTGPLTLGRWQQPAALVLAGRVTPDPYPLEQILCCATCGQQFFGTHLTGGGARVYRTCCNCRPRPLPAGGGGVRGFFPTPLPRVGTPTIHGFINTPYTPLAGGGF